MRLLVVEDDPQIAQGLTRGLRRSGYAVDCLSDGAEADAVLCEHDYGLVVLDLGLPGMDGLTLLRNLRSRKNKASVLVLTARDELDDRLRGLDLGADDYMAKPFALSELESRIRAITRRAAGRSGGDISVGNLTYRMSERRIVIDGIPIDLTPRELGLLELLLLRRERVVSKAQIEEHLCDWNGELADSAIELYVHRLRRKLENAAVEIRTLRGFGYLLREAPPLH